MKNIEIQMLLYTLTNKLMVVQENMLNIFGIILFYKVMGWINGQDIGIEPKSQGDQGSIPFTNIYYVEYVYSYTYLVHVCKCIIPRWVVGG
jgi:hypothetical protein